MYLRSPEACWFCDMSTCCNQADLSRACTAQHQANQNSALQAKPADPVPIPAKVFKGKGKSKAAEIETKGKTKVADPLPKSGGSGRTAQAKDRPKAAGPQAKDAQQHPAPKPL